MERLTKFQRSRLGVDYVVAKCLNDLQIFGLKEFFSSLNQRIFLNPLKKDSEVGLNLIKFNSFFFKHHTTDRAIDSDVAAWIKSQRLNRGESGLLLKTQLNTILSLKQFIFSPAGINHSLCDLS